MKTGFDDVVGGNSSCVTVIIAGGIMDWFFSCGIDVDSFEAIPGVNCNSLVTSSFEFFSVVACFDDVVGE